MAYFNCEFPKEFFKKLHSLENTEEVSKKMLTEAIPVIQKRFADYIKSNHSDTGALWRSIKAFNPWKDKNEVWHISAAATGRANGLRKSSKVYARSNHGTKTRGQALFNDDKVWWIEYGSSTQDARPFLDKIANDSENEVAEIMQKVFNEEVEKA